jgi:hypothetical protein
VQRSSRLPGDRPDDVISGERILYNESYDVNGFLSFGYFPVSLYPEKCRWGIVPRIRSCLLFLRIRGMLRQRRGYLPSSICLQLTGPTARSMVPIMITLMLTDLLEVLISQRSVP